MHVSYITGVFYTGLLTECMPFINQIIEKGILNTLGTTLNGHNMVPRCTEEGQQATFSNTVTFSSTVTRQAMTNVSVGLM